MNLKTFKEGVEYISKATNQREKTPVPFVVQVDSQHALSLIAGDERATFVWRTGITLEVERQRFAIPSKMLIQASKALKGAKLTVDLSVSADGLRVTTSSGGSVALPRAFDEPQLFRPFPIAEEPVMSLRDGTLARWSGAISTTSSENEDAVQFDTDGRVSSTDGYIMFDTHGTMSKEIPSPRWVRGTFWNALQHCRDNAELVFSESGLRVQSGPYAAFTGFLGASRVLPDMKQHYYPDGQVPPVYVVVDKKTFISNVKAVASVAGSYGQQIFLSLPLKENVLVIKGIQTNENIVMDYKKRGKGWGTTQCAAKYLVNVLNAIEGKEVIISWNENQKDPIGVRDTAQQHEWFLIAPVLSV